MYSLTPSNGFDGRRPGPIVPGGDGHFYGVTDLPNSGVPSRWGLFRLRAGAGGTFTYERLREFDEALAGRPSQVRLTLGVDGLLYGYAQAGGPSGNGTLFRFDPSGGGPPADPIAFTVLHTFPQLNTWNPVAPVLAADGFLYGLTNAGGAHDRGAVYRLNADTGAVAILGDVPATNFNPHIVSSALVPGPDGLLYGTSAAGPTEGATTTPVEFHILRVTPASGAATVAVGPIDASVAPSGLVRTPAGTLYGPQRRLTPRGIVRFDPVANTVATVTSLEATASLFLSPLTATSDGNVYALSQTAIPNPLTARIFTTRTFLLRLNPASATGVDAITLGDDILRVIDRVVETSDGSLYFAASYQGTEAVVGVDRVTGTLRRVCTLPTISHQHMSAGPDGALYGFETGQFQRMFRCDPTTGAVTFTVLPPDVGRVVEPLTTIGGMLYGAAVGEGPGTGGTVFRFAPGGTLPALDSDADGLPNVWETAYGLDPFGTGPGNGPADDPDGDGRTNAQELADGTHPNGVVTRYLAEGATGAFFHTRLDLANPGAGPAIVLLRFLTDTGARIPHVVVIPPHSHTSFDPATIAGLAHATFSTVIEADATVAVDRTMSWGASGYGSHVETAVAAPATTWYFAEGSTSGPFALFYLLQNPQSTPVDATVRYLRPLGLPPIEKVYTLLPFSRTTIVVDGEGADLASTDVSAVITAASPIVAERAMYYSQPDQPFAAGHESAGVTAPALEWFLAEGATGTFFDLFVLIANPNASAATVAVEYLLVGGGSETRTYTVAGNSRSTIWVDDEQLPPGSGLRPFANVSLSMVVRSTNGVPIVVERTMWWPGPALTSNFWYEAHNSPGATTTATRWVVAGGDIGGPADARTFVLIANPSTSAGRARLTVLDANGWQILGEFDLPPKSRTNAPIARSLINFADTFAVVVESLGQHGAPIVVEHATYSSPGGVLWGSGGNALAVPLP